MRADSIRADSFADAFDVGYQHVDLQAYHEGAVIEQIEQDACSSMYASMIKET